MANTDLIIKVAVLSQKVNKAVSYMDLTEKSDEVLEQMIVVLQKEIDEK